jgi:hypothetical protein
MTSVENNRTAEGKDGRAKIDGFYSQKGPQKVRMQKPE